MLYVLCHFSIYIHILCHLGNSFSIFSCPCAPSHLIMFSQTTFEHFVCVLWDGQAWHLGSQLSAGWDQDRQLLWKWKLLCAYWLLFLFTCSLDMLIKTLFSQLVCQLWVNFQNEGKPRKKDFKSKTWFLKCQPWLPWPTPPTWRIAVQCKIWRLLILSTKKLPENRLSNV